MNNKKYLSQFLNIGFLIYLAYLIVHNENKFSAIVIFCIILSMSCMLIYCINLFKLLLKYHKKIVVYELLSYFLIIVYFITFYSLELYYHHFIYKILFFVLAIITILFGIIRISNIKKVTYVSNEPKNIENVFLTDKSFIFLIINFTPLIFAFIGTVIIGLENRSVCLYIQCICYFMAFLNILFLMINHFRKCRVLKLSHIICLTLYATLIIFACLLYFYNDEILNLIIVLLYFTSMILNIIALRGVYDLTKTEIGE